MTAIAVIVRLWEELRRHGAQTIEVIENARCWEFQVNEHEYSVRQTFNHTVQAIFEDAGNWFLNDSTRFSPSQLPKADLNRAIDRMIDAIKDFSDDKLSMAFTFQWGEHSTVEGAILQNLFHAIGHFSQLRNWVGIHRRTQKQQATKTYL
ncbi:MAG: hypothetical protein ACFE89_06310 [Candidatus Hodarchaeota archaeon]